MRTFIVRLREEADGTGRTGAAVLPPLRGVVDDVATGMRATFRNDQELVMALMAAVGAGPPGPKWSPGAWVPRDPHSDRTDPTRKEN